MALTKISRGLLSTGVSDSSDATAITIDSSERVGIGTTSPSIKLEAVTSHNPDGSGIYADAANQLHLKNTSTTDNASSGMIYSSGAGAGVLTSAVFPNADTNREAHFIISTANSGGTLAERVRIASDGKLGIGTTSPAVMLDVRGEVAVDYNATYGLRFYNQSRNNWASIGNPSTSSNADMVFKSGGGEAMKILHNGRVGIGTSSPGYHFHLKDTGNGTIYQMEATGGNNIYKAFTNTGGTSYIGTENQDWKFYVGGSVKFEVTSSGGSSVSDEKFKENIQDISYGLDTVKALKPRHFKWKDSQEDNIGFIAQEVKPIISEVINVPTVTPPEGMVTGMSMNYSALTAVLTKAIQELSTKLEAAEARITTLEG
jgi:hypothetical protein